MKTIKLFTVLMFVFIFSIFISGCKNTEESEMSDEQYFQQIVTSGYDNDESLEDNLMKQEIVDLDDGGAINDDIALMSPMDSLIRWGRLIQGADVNIQNAGNDETRNIVITRTIRGIYRIIGLKNNQIDSVDKPYTTVLTRNIIFKRVGRTPHPRLNWRVYQVSNLDGGTTQPQIGSSQVQITRIDIFRNFATDPTYSLIGPDFQNTYYTSLLFGALQIPEFRRDDLNIKIKVYTNSQQSDPDYVAFHWAKNTFGFHRIPFTLDSINGNYRVYSKSFKIYSNHKLGVFNGYISASTHESLYDDDVSKFASDLVGIPYRIRQ
jgi:hypothetical protein